MTSISYHPLYNYYMRHKMFNDRNLPRDRPFQRVGQRAATTQHEGVVTARIALAQHLNQPQIDPRGQITSGARPSRFVVIANLSQSSIRPTRCSKGWAGMSRVAGGAVQEGGTNLRHVISAWLTDFFLHKNTAQSAEETYRQRTIFVSHLNPIQYGCLKQKGGPYAYFFIVSITYSYARRGVRR